MIVAAAVCLVVAVGLGIALVRTRTRLADLEVALRTTIGERDGLEVGLEEGHREAADARRERDDAISCVQRARRDAVGTSDLLWELALGRAERTWRTSISLGLDEASPLTTSSDPLRAAIEIEIEAAREEAGADIELRWTGEGPVPPGTAIVVLSVVEAAVASVAKTAASTTVEVDAGPNAVEVAFRAVDDAGGTIELDVPGSDAERPGRVVVPVPISDVSASSTTAGSR